MRQHRIIRSTSLCLNAVIGGTFWALAWSGVAMISYVLPPWRAVSWMLTTVAVLLLFPELGPARWRRRRAATLGLRPIGAGLPWLGLAGAALLVTTLLLIGVHAQLTTDPGPDRFPYRFPDLPWGGLVPPVFGIVVAPLVEEMAFRGFVQGRIARRLGPTLAVVIAAAPFAAVHVAPAWILYYFVLGLFLGYARVVTRSLAAPIALHAAVNALLFTLPAALGTWLFSRGTAALWLLVPGLIAAAAAAAVALRASGQSSRRQRFERVRQCATRLVLSPILTPGGPPGPTHAP